MEAPRINISNLEKRFGGLRAVRNLSLHVNPGEIVSLLGPNGAGKTTTIRMLIGILRPSAGTACVAGYDCFSQRPEVMQHTGYLPDEPVFYDYLTGHEILNFVREMHGLDPVPARKRLQDLVERLDLSDALYDYTVNYSKGMRKKFALVCALLHEPDVLILDEPTNGLDPFATRAVHDILNERVSAGASVLFSTHLLDQAERLSDRVAIVYKGELAAVGQIDELRRRLRTDGSLEQVFFAAVGDSPNEPNA